MRQPLVGRVVYEVGGERLEAVLDSDLRWHVGDRTTEETLAILCGIETVEASDGDPGWNMLGRAAGLLNGIAEWDEDRPGPTGRIAY